MRRGMWMMLCACAVAWSLAGNTRAQDALLNDLYGLGVHAYYSNDYFRAHELLTSAVEQGSQDPRVFYFRGLTYQMLGRPDEARDDFRQGAQLELTTISPVPIGHSLQRVQGSTRLMLEGYRREAKLAARSQQMAVERARYEELERNESDMRRDPNARNLPVPNLPAANVPDELAPFPGAGNEPVPVPATPPATTPAPAPASDPFGSPAPGADPFGSPAPAPAADPFGTPATEPAAEPDPFGAPAPAPATEPDPFGAPMPVAPAGDSDPFSDDNAVAPAGQPMPENDDSDLLGNPFADDDAGAAAPAPAPAPAPAAAPAGEAMPADDPFGDPFAN
ncbi:MAG: hypothetical protein KDA38_00195 [Planctomycetales bacterium]|nr:hypothetical protein [Planctomycetales bacterium]